jgi:bifunctional enzyme CysN/CysC/sulfate adenylyltransferase subunit 1
VPHLVLAVNKMDLVGYDQAAFGDRRRVHRVRRQLDIRDLSFVPISALHGDNVVSAANMAWHDGPPLLSR